MNTNKKLVTVMIVFLFLFSLAFAQARLGNFERRECVDIKTISNSSAMNISTISFPRNGSTAVSNKAMTKIGQTFNYTFCDTLIIGTYNYDYFDAEGNVFVNDFVITPIGDDITTGSSILYIIILIFISLFFVFFLVIAYYSPYGNITFLSTQGPVVTKVTRSKYIKLISAWIAYGMFLWVIVILTGMINNYIKFEALRSLATNLYRFLNIVGYGVSVGIIWLLFYNLWKDIILNKTIITEGKALLKKL